MPKLLPDVIVQVVWGDGQVDRTAVSSRKELAVMMERISSGLETRLIESLQSGERASAVVTFIPTTNFDKQGETNEVQDPQDPG